MNKDMKKDYRNRQFKIGSLTYIIAVLLLAALIISGLFSREMKKIKEKYNIEKTSVDFIIQTPSDEQVEEIRSLSHVNSVTPFYFSAGNATIKGKTVRTEMYLVKSADDLPNTLFSDKLLVREITEPCDGATVYIDSCFSDNNRLSVGDKIKLQNAAGEVECVVGKIYNADGRHDNGLLMAVYEGAIKESIGEAVTLRYSGAYVDSKDVILTEEYLKSYIPEGDLRPRTDFDSDELYEAYLNTHNSADSSQTTFYRDRYIKEVNNRYSGQLYRDLVLSFVFIVFVMVIGIIAFTVQPYKYIKNDVIKDIRNNYSFEQEKEMFFSYFASTVVLTIVSASIGSCINVLVLKLSAVNIPLIVGMVAAVVMVIIPLGCTMNKLGTEYYEKAKQVEEEKRREAERKTVNE